MSLIGINMNNFHYKHIGLAFPQPVFRGADVLEKAQKLMEIGSTLPALSIGFSSLPGGSRYWKTNGPVQGAQV